MSEESKDYALGDILSITTYMLVSDRHMDGVYDILNFMTGETLFTHQLPRAAEQCRPILLEQLPQLAAIDLGEDFEFTGKEHVEEWLAEQVKLFGEKLPVRPLATPNPTVNPIEELADMVGPENIYVVNPIELKEDG